MVRGEPRADAHIQDAFSPDRVADPVEPLALVEPRIDPIVSTREPVEEPLRSAGAREQAHPSPDESDTIECVSSPRSDADLAAFHEDGPAEGPEALAVECEPELAHLEEVEQRSELGSELLFAHDGRALFRGFLRVPCEAQPAGALVRHPLEQFQERGESPDANAVIDAPVEHDIVRSAEIHSSCVSHAKVDLDARLLRLLPRPPDREVDEID